MAQCSCGICGWCKSMRITPEPIQSAFVKYRSLEWYLLVASGWATAEVNYEQGSWRIAKMIKGGD